MGVPARTVHDPLLTLALGARSDLCKGAMRHYERKGTSAPTYQYEGFEMSSLLEKWHPVTHDFGLIQTPLKRVISELEDWHGSFGTKYVRTEIASSLADDGLPKTGPALVDLYQS